MRTNYWKERKLVNNATNMMVIPTSVSSTIQSKQMMKEEWKEKGRMEKGRKGERIKER